MRTCVWHRASHNSVILSKSLLCALHYDVQSQPGEKVGKGYWSRDWKAAMNFEESPPEWTDDAKNDMDQENNDEDLPPPSPGPNEEDFVEFDENDFDDDFDDDFEFEPEYEAEIEREFGDLDETGEGEQTPEEVEEPVAEAADKDLEESDDFDNEEIEEGFEEEEEEGEF